MAFASHDFEEPDSDEAVAVARGFADTAAGTPLLIKLAEAWYLEGRIFHWVDNPDGIVGRQSTERSRFCPPTSGTR